MTDTKRKTTIGIHAADAGPIRDLAMALGQTQQYGGQTIGNVSLFAHYLADLVRDHGADTVAAALSSGRLAEVAGGMEEADDEG